MKDVWIILMDMALCKFCMMMIDPLCFIHVIRLGKTSTDLQSLFGDTFCNVPQKRQNVPKLQICKRLFWRHLVDVRWERFVEWRNSLLPPQAYDTPSLSGRCDVAWCHRKEGIDVRLSFFFLHDSAISESSCIVGNRRSVARDREDPKLNSNTKNLSNLGQTGIISWNDSWPVFPQSNLGYLKI